MNRKNLWLSTSALVGAAMIATPSLAGQVGSKDSMSLTLEGEFLFQIGILDQDVSAAAGRGYQFKVDESEIVIGAESTADNGIKYGVSIELNAVPARGGSVNALRQGSAPGARCARATATLRRLAQRSRRSATLRARQ